MKTLLAPATMALALILPATAGAATVGTTTVHLRGASTVNGVAKAYRFTAASTGPVDRLNVYLDGANTASRVEVGLYSGSRSSAGTRRRSCVISRSQPNAWNRCSFTAYSISAGAYYWLALLHPSASRGKLQYREGQVSGAPASYLSRNRSLPTLPSTWTNSSRSSDVYQASIYADQAGGPTPPPPPPPDGDGDGVPDGSDQCPGTPAGTRVDANGCPITLPPPTPMPGPPVATFTVSPNPAVRNQPVTFTSTGTCPGVPCSYAWVNNDGVQFGSGETATFTYVGTTGPRETTLRVTDAAGRVASVQKSFQLVEAQPAPLPDPACSDGQDNDGDGQTDYPSDPGCSSASDEDEANVIDPPPPSGDCDLNATPSTFSSEVSAAATGQTICLASGDYGTWSGTNKAITVRAADGAAPMMRFNFGAGDGGFTLDGVVNTGGTIANGATNITVRDSEFTGTVNVSGSGTDGIVFDGNTHNWPVASQTGGPNAKVYLENSLTGTLANPSVTIKNSEIRNGDLDGIHFGGGSGYQIVDNRVLDLCDRGVNHTDGMQFDTSRTREVRIAGNYVAFAACGGYGQAITSYDAGTAGVLIEDNAVDTRRPWGIELYADQGSTVRHNTVRYYPDADCSFNGLTCGKIDITRKAADPAGTGTQAYDNVATVQFGAESTGTAHHNTNPATVTYVGPLTSWAGFELAAGSPAGKGAASDGLDTGIRVP